MNLDYRIDNYRFNARVSAIIYNIDKTKVLLFTINDGRDYYMLPGGRIEMYEDSLSAIKREIKEETGFILDFDLCSIQENFVTRNNVNITQYCFCYKALYSEDIKKLQFICKDNDNQHFKWFDINKIENIKIYPNSTKKLITQDDNHIKHIIEK